MGSGGPRGGSGMGGGGNLGRDEPGPVGLLSGHPVSGGPSLSEQVLDKVQQRLGVKTNKLNDLAHVISGMESSYGKNLFNPTSTAKGIYQFTDDSFETAKNRLSNVLARGAFPASVPARIMSALSVDLLSPDDQKALFFAHLSEDSGSDQRIIDYIQQGTSGAELYIQDHYKDNPTQETRERMPLFFGPGSDKIQYYLED